MFRALLIIAAACWLRTSGQHTDCQTDRQCQIGFYCVPDVFLCRRCLVCEELKRDPPRAPTDCIKSVAECGSCIKGLVDNLRGDVTAECVAEGGEGAGAALPAWAWVAVSLGLLLFVLVVIAGLYVLRNTNTFKILASTSQSVSTSVRSPGVTSAPEAPPPYRAHYHHQHHQDNDDHYEANADGDAEAGYDRGRVPPSDDDSPSAPCDGDSPHATLRAAGKLRPPPSGPREASASQATRYYSAPYYVRPPRYSDAGVSSPPPGLSPSLPAAPQPPLLHDEDTMESAWTPNERHDDDNGNATGGSELAELLAAARLADHRHQHHQQHHYHPHHHQHCTQDSNNNRSSGSAPSGAAPAASSAPPTQPVSYIINVVQNMQKRT